MPASKTLFLKDKILSTKNAAFVMGIVNATPDSFWKNSRGGVALARRHIAQGADILDVGGESTRPGFCEVFASEEIRRVVPLIKKIRKFSDIPISVDTRKYDVMSAAFDAGADILNDVSALQDERLAAFVCSQKIPVIFTHGFSEKSSCKTQPNSAIMEGDIFFKVNSFLCEKVELALQRGIQKEKIIVDPGFGFGKTFGENAALVKKCGELCGGRFPVLAGVSRKSFLQKIAEKNAGSSLFATVAANSLCVFFGASILRVHDAGPAVDAAKIAKGILGE